MRGTFELVDYTDRGKALDNPRVVVMDAGLDNDMVRIRIGSEEHGCQTVKVVGKELIRAAESCMRINYPYV